MKLLCMSFDGDCQIERPVFDSIDKTWEYSNNIGSKWFFYPFHFVVTDTGKTVVDAPNEFKWFEGRRIETIKRIFNKYSKSEECQEMDCDEFAWHIFFEKEANFDS